MHIVDDGCREEDAHRTLATGQQVQLFLVWHRCTPFASCKDNGLATLRNGELTLQLGSGGKERRDARRDVIVHVVGIKEGHLLLNSPEDAGVAGMQADDVLPLVIELLHQLALLFERHVGRAAYNSAGLVAFRQGLGH